MIKFPWKPLGEEIGPAKPWSWENLSHATSWACFQNWKPIQFLQNFLSSRLQNPQSRNNSVRGYPLVVIGYFKPPMYALSCSWHCHWYVLEDTQTFKSNLFCICICLPFRISSFLTCLMVFGSFVSSILKVNLSLQIFIYLSNIGFSYIHPRDGGWITWYWFLIFDIGFWCWFLIHTPKRWLVGAHDVNW